MRVHLTKIESTAIKEVKYFDKIELLSLKFYSSNTTYYYKVPKDMFIGFLQAESKGTFFNNHIKKNSLCLEEVYQLTEY